MSAPIVRRPSSLLEVRAFAWHPDEATMTVLSAAPPLPPALIYADSRCACGRQLLDATDSPQSGHDGRRVVTWRGAIYGSAKCAEADYYAGQDDREVPGVRVSPVPPAGLVDATRVPVIVPFDATDPAVHLAQLAEVTRRLLALDTGAGSFYEAEQIRVDAERILAAIGGAA
ncbi:hypothetical protein [Catenuloplanes indicus]|uniref:Uncharacterized protein n=1 Tax=Catenuloplanes indicus TaxID=137267 RepID=A0AAE3W8Q2_9ACTN|nr:hypothetical protein [Catenuloplanes indicus]MDQ0371546.1 hypothetical protein [Catenuloplanes indicus]